MSLIFPTNEADEAEVFRMRPRNLRCFDDAPEGVLRMLRMISWAMGDLGILSGTRVGILRTGGRGGFPGSSNERPAWPERGLRACWPIDGVQSATGWISGHIFDRLALVFTLVFLRWFFYAGFGAG